MMLSLVGKELNRSIKAAGSLNGGADGIVDEDIMSGIHDDVIKWEHLPRYWPFVRGIHRPPVNFPLKGQ